ncbi:MAG TPA: hypothetical protein VIF62_16875, partial [Labilithrix sp.]
MLPREIEVDVARAVEAVEGVESVHALDSASDDPERLCFAIVLGPYTAEKLVEVHYALLERTDHAVAGRVLYVDLAGHPPYPMRQARRLTIAEAERTASRARAKLRLADTERVRWLEQQDADRAAWATELRKMLARDAPISASMQSGAFEIVPDPFPSAKRPRVLVADPDPSTALLLKPLDADLVVAEEGWSVVDHLSNERFDLVVCALKFDDGLTGAKIHRMIAKERPDAAARIVFVADKVALAGAPPSSAIGRVVSRPVDVGIVKDILARLATVAMLVLLVACEEKKETTATATATASATASATATPTATPSATASAIPDAIAAQHVLVAYKGAKNAPSTVTRSKADAKKLADDIAARAKSGEE